MTSGMSITNLSSARACTHARLAHVHVVFTHTHAHTPSTDINSHTWNGFYLGVPLPYIIPECSTGWLDWDSRQVGRTTLRHMELTSFYAVAAELRDSGVSRIYMPKKDEENNEGHECHIFRMPNGHIGTNIFKAFVIETRIALTVRNLFETDRKHSLVK